MAYYNKLSDKIRNQESLPDGLAWEDMEAGIMNKMSGKKDKKRRFLWILFPLLAVVGLGAIFFMSYKGTSDSEPQLKQIPTIIAAENSDVFRADALSESSKQNATILKEVDSQSIILPKDQQIDNVKISKSINNSQNTDQNKEAYPLNSKNENYAHVKGHVLAHTERNKSNNKGIIEYSENENNQSTNAQNTTSEIFGKGSDGNSGNMSLPNDSDKKTYAINISSETHYTKPNSIDNEVSYIPTLDHLDFLPGSEMVELETMKSERPKLALNHIKTSFIKPSAISYFGKTDMYFYGGYSHWQLMKVTNQGVGIENVFDVSEKSLPSFNLGVRGDVSLTKNIYASTGIECMSLYSVYDYHSVKSVAVTQQNVVTQIRYDLISSNTSNVYGDTTIMAPQTRQARVRNNIFNVAIPIIVGLQTRIGNWTVKGGLGTMFSVFTSAKGKTEYEGNYVTVDHNGLFKNTLGVALTGDVSAQYQWSSRFFIGAKISATHFANTFAIPNKSISLPTIYGISITSGMKF